jgi:hypothetical protein
MNRRKSPIVRSIPRVVFTVSTAAWLHADAVMETVGLASSDRVRVYWVLIPRTLAWIFGAELFNQISGRILWGGIVARTFPVKQEGGAR